MSRCSDPTLVAVVVPRVRRRRARDARDRTEIFIDCPEVVVGHVLDIEPHHYLEKITVEWRRYAAWVYGSCAGRMEVIQIHARPHDPKKVGERDAPLRPPSFVRGQVAGDNVRRTRYEGAEMPSSAQVSVGIDLLRLAEEWISTRGELVVPGACGQKNGLSGSTKPL